MNSFQDTTSGQGLLKTNYDGESDISRAMRKRRKTLEDQTVSLTKDDVEGVQDERDR